MTLNIDNPGALRVDYVLFIEGDRSDGNFVLCMGGGFRGKRLWVELCHFSLNPLQYFDLLFTRRVIGFEGELSVQELMVFDLCILNDSCQVVVFLKQGICNGFSLIG